MQFTKAVRGTLYLTIQQLIQYLAAFIFYAGVARFITQAEVGLWSILTASTGVFTTLTLFGLPLATQKYVSENYGRGDLGSTASVSRLSFTIVASFTLPTLIVALLLPSSFSTLASKAQIKIDLSHFARTTALAVIVALPLGALDYVLTNLYLINPITRLILEGVSLLIIYVISLRLLRIIKGEDLGLLKKGCPH